MKPVRNLLLFLLALNLLGNAEAKEPDFFIPDGWILIPAAALAYPEKVLQSMPYGKYYQSAKMAAWDSKTAGSIGGGEIVYCQWPLEKGSDQDNINNALKESFNPKWPIVEKKNLAFGAVNVTRVILNIPLYKKTSQMAAYFYRDGDSLDGILGVSSDQDFDKFAPLFEDTLAHSVQPNDPSLKPNSDWATYSLDEYHFSFESPLQMQLIGLPTTKGFFLNGKGFYKTLGLTVSTGPFKKGLRELADDTLAFLQSPQERYTHIHPTYKAMLCSGNPALLMEGSFIDSKGVAGKMKSFAVKKGDQIWKMDIFYRKTDKSGEDAAKRIMKSLSIIQ